jgi:hypothetical protein
MTVSEDERDRERVAFPIIGYGYDRTNPEHVKLVDAIRRERKDCPHCKANRERHE